MVILLIWILLFLIVQRFIGGGKMTLLMKLTHYAVKTLPFYVENLIVESCDFSIVEIRTLGHMNVSRFHYGKSEFFIILHSWKTDNFIMHRILVVYRSECRRLLFRLQALPRIRLLNSHAWRWMKYMYIVAIRDSSENLYENQFFVRHGTYGSATRT